MNKYNEEDFRKLKSVLSDFEKLESKLGDYVSVDYREELGNAGILSTMLYSVRRFIGVELKEQYKGDVFALSFVSADNGITSVKDSESDTLYSNSNEMCEVIFKNNSKWNVFERKIDLHKYEPWFFRENRDIELESLGQDLYDRLKSTSQNRRRQLFGNIIADIEVNYRQTNGKELFSYGEVDDDSYISMLEIYDKELPEGYSVFLEPEDEYKRNELLNFAISIHEFIKENFSRFNDEKLDIMVNMIDYLHNQIGDKEAVVMYDQIQAIKNTMNLVASENDFGDEFNKEFNRKDLMSLGTMYFMATKLDKKIYAVDDNLIFYVINSLRGEMYDHYPVLLKGLLHEELLDGVKTMQEDEPFDTDRIRSVFNSLVDNHILEDDMSEEKFEGAMKHYLVMKEIPTKTIGRTI